MINFKSFSIKKKLIAIQLLTTFIVLISCFIFFAVYDMHVFSKYLFERLISSANLISKNSVSSLAFLDNQSAEEILKSLDMDEDIVNAWIRDNQGELFAKYSKSGYEGYDYPKMDSSYKRIQGCYTKRFVHGQSTRSIVISKVMTAGDDELGVLSLRLNVKEYEHFFIMGMVMAIVVLFVGMGLALLLASITQKSISKPILQLADAGKRVIGTKDYSIRVTKQGDDEIGALYDDFNNIMSQVHVREQERDKAYISLRASEEKYRTLFDNMYDGFAYHRIITNKHNEPVDYVFLEVNAAFEKFTGLKGVDIINKKVTDIIPQVGDAERNLINEYGRVALTGQSANLELYFEPFKKWYAVSAYSPGQGFFCTVFKDVTAKKDAEEMAKQHREKLIQTDKMATLGILVSGVAHEINNPNNFMLLNSNNLSDIWKDLKPHLDEHQRAKGDFIIAGLPFSEVRGEMDMLIDGIAEGSGRIKKIVESLKNFARKDPGNMDQPVNINTIIESSLIIMSNLIKKSTDHLNVSYHEKLPEVRGNAQQIEQVIINLLSNACQALSDKSKNIYITTCFNQDTNEAVIEIRDEGDGISKESIKHIMDPFYTTKRDSGGTGLGLSISYTIIKDHNGDMKIESEPGEGTVATIILPAV